MSAILEIKDLHVEVEDTEILKGVNLKELVKTHIIVAPAREECRS